MGRSKERPKDDKIVVSPADLYMHFEIYDYLEDRFQCAEMGLPGA